MDLRLFKNQLDTFISTHNGNGQTVISIKAEDLYTLIKLAEMGLIKSSRRLFESSTPKEVMPQEKSSADHSYVNSILSNET
jgi:hypothetical protein